MTPEEIWEKKGSIGMLAVVLFFAGGLFFLENIKSEEKGWATIESIRKRGNSTQYEILVRSKPGGDRLFRQTVKNPKGKLKDLKEKKPGDQFEIKFTTSEEGPKITKIPKSKTQ